MGAQLYSLKDVTIMVREVRVEGFSPNDAFGFQWMEDLMTPDITADGQVVVSKTNNNAAMVTLSLMNTSEAYRRLALMMDEQHGLTVPLIVPVLLPLPFLMSDPIIGDLVASEYCVFMNRPAPQKGKQASTVQFNLLLPNPRVQYGLLNTRLIS